MKKITTEKGTFGIKDYNSWSELIIDANFYKLKLGKSIFKLSSITEEQAIGIVKETNDIQPNIYKYYGFYDQIFFKAIDSLNSLLELHNIEINENTYIFKL